MTLRIQSFLLLTFLPFLAFGQCTSKLTVQASPTVVLDFDGDGITDIITAQSLSSQTNFVILRSSDQGLVESSFGVGRPAPGDYDGDGIWDLGVVSKSKNRPQWEIKLSSTGETVTRKFGTVPDQVLSGCRFISNKTSLAYVKNRRLFATEIGGDGTRKIGFRDLSSGDLLGCGDVDGDGIDEPIFRTKTTEVKIDSLATPGCRNEILLYKTIKPFNSLGVVQQSTDDFPIVISARPASKSKSVISLESLSEVFTYPKFNVREGTKFSSGLFKLGSSETSYGVLFQEKKGLEIKQRLFSKSPQTADVVSTGLQGTLVAPQEVYLFDKLE